MERQRQQSKQTAEQDGVTKQPKRTSAGSAAERTSSPAPSCVSMKSDASMDFLYEFGRGKKISGKSNDEERPNLASPSKLSVVSDESELIQDDEDTFLRLHPSASAPVRSKPHVPQVCRQHNKPLEIYCNTEQMLICKQCATVEHGGHNKSYTRTAKALLELDTLTLLEQTLNNLDTNKFMCYLCQNYPECFESAQVTSDIQEASKLILEKFGSDAAPKIALKVMLELGKSHKTIQDHLKSKLQDHLRPKFQCIGEGNAQQGNQILLNDIFTELFITEGGDGAINKEHEIRQIEDASKNKGAEEIVIKCNDIFQPLPGQNKRIRTVLTKGLLPKACVESLEETVDYIKEKIRKESSAERTINLFHCLNELNYNSLVEEIRSFLRSGKQSEAELKPDQCSALAYVLLTSEDVINEFDLKMCNTSPEGYRRLLPVVKTSRKASLAGVNLTDESCEILASILQSANSHLVELDLSFNSLGDLGVKLLCIGLSNQHSRLEKLTLSHNQLEHIGVKLLCDCLMSPHCKLQTLGLAGTNFSEQSCELMAAVFQSANSHLKELDLGCNTDIKDSGVKLLCTGLISIHCKIEKLSLDRCDLSHESCEALKTALQSPNSCLRKLDLGYNKLGDSGVQQLCDGLTHLNCKLDLLDLSYNNLGHTGVKLLSTGLMNPECKLKSLRLADVSIPEETCETLALALQSENPHLRELDLSNNYIGDSGVELLCAGLISPNCFLEKLSLSGCCVTEDGCSTLALALSSAHSQLRELDLSYNHPGESGVRQLSAVRDNPQCNLEKLSVDHCGECRIKPGLKKYACEITLDPNTAHRTMPLSGDKKVTRTRGQQPYPDHPDRFEYYAQVLCREPLSGARFYWETEWTGNNIYNGVTYKGINRKGRSNDCKLGMNNKSWILFCSNNYGYYAGYNNKETVVSPPPNPSRRLGIYLDWQAGTLSYFIISSDRVYHTYTFHTTFTEALYPGFRVDDTLTLCELE
ncbi:NACHT, LRR and PYD domains-containing protein 12-like [Tachysurus ichikawai]